MNAESALLRESLFIELDLNLLLTFAVLYRECSVSNAAKCLRLGQPAVSNALARLRLYFNDPLFRRGYRRMNPTPKATRIAEAIFPALQGVQEALRCAGSTCGPQR